MIVNYNILNPKIDNKMPFFNEKRGIFYFPVNDINYRYYLEVSKFNDIGDIEYYFLIGNTKFDKNCKKCNVDDLRRCQIRPKGVILNYIKKETKERGNINCNYIESFDNYDVWLIE